MDMSNKTSDNTERLKQLAEELRESNEIKRFYGNNFTEGSKYCIISETELIPTAEAIEEVLAEREQKDKQIKELEEERDHWHGCFIVAMENSIAKEKVMDKIKEIKYLQSRTITSEAYNITQGEIIVLQELLERKK